MFADRNALRLVLARFVSRSGGEAAFFVGIWGKAAFELDATASALAWIIAATGVAGLLGAAAAGALVDRFDPKKVLVAGEALFVPVTLAFLAVEDLRALTVVSFLLGLVSAPVYTAITSMPPFLVDDEWRLARLNGAVETAGMAALISGTAVGALLVGLWSIDAIFVFDALTSLVAVALVMGMSLRPAERALRDRSGLAELREGFRYAYASRRLRFFMLTGTSAWLLFGLFGSLEPLFYRDVLGTGPEAIGWVNTIFGAGLVGGTVVATRLPPRMRTARTVVALLSLNGLASVLYTGTARLPVVVAGAVAWGLLIGVFAPLVRTLVHLDSPEHLVGRIQGASLVHSEAAKLVPLLAAPGLAAAFGVQQTLAASGLVLTAIAAAVWRPAAAIDRARVEQAPAVEPGRVADEPITPIH